MKKLSTIVMAAVCLSVCIGAFAGETTGPPAPVPYKKIIDPPDDAQRHITVTADDRGPVWLLTGLLSDWKPQIDFETIARLKLKHWRYDLWPVWYPVSVTEDGRKGRKSWGDWRDSPVAVGTHLQTMMRLQEQGMTWQPVLHHKGRYYGRYRITKDMLEDFYDHMYTLVKYSRSMGIPFDYYEICNEPGGRYGAYYEDARGYTFKGTWAEFTDMWDTAYRAIRDAYPEAKIVGPSYAPSYTDFANLEPFLDHCKEKGQRLDVLSWHMPSLRSGQKGELTWIVPDAAHQQIEAVQEMVAEEYASLGIKEIHIDEWGIRLPYLGPGTAMAIFHYFDLAGVHRAAKAQWSEGPLNGLLVNAKTPRTSYWCWAEYAKQKGGVRLVTETNDRGVVALASRHDDQGIVRALVARSKRNYGKGPGPRGKQLPPVKTTVGFEGLPVEGRAEVTIIKMGPYYGPMWEEDLVPRSTVMTVVDGGLSLVLDEVQENQVYSIAVEEYGGSLKAGKEMKADPEPVTKAEDFNGYKVTGDWKPAPQGGWILTKLFKAKTSKVILSKEYGRGGSMGLAGVRKASSPQVSYWRVKLNRKVDTLCCQVMAGGPGTGVEISTRRAGATAGLISVGYKDRIRILHQPGAAQAGATIVPADKFSANRWYKVELQHDFDAGRQRARVDGGEWTAWIPMVDDDVTEITSVVFYSVVTGDNEFSFAIDDIATYPLETS